MRVCVTGATNPVGEAIVRALALKGHHVRAFGVAAGDDRYDGFDVQTFPGWVEVAGSLEPVLSEREALVHAACLDAPGKGRESARKHAIRIQKGTLYARYAAEREQVDHFVHVTPADPGKTYGALQEGAVSEVEATRGLIHVHVVVHEDDVAGTAQDVVDALESVAMLGSIVGGHDNAVTK